MMSESKTNRPPARRRGVFLIAAACTMGLLVLVAGLCLETGNIAVKRAVLQDGADAAARSGAVFVGYGRDTARYAAYLTIVDNARANGFNASGASVNLEYGRWSLEDKRFEPLYQDAPEADAARITVSMPVPSIFVGGDTMKTNVHVQSAIARRPTLVLVVKDSKNPLANDAEMLRRMKQWGIPTQMLSEGKLTSNLFRTEDVVMISSSAQSSVIAGKLKDAPCAVIICELNNWKELGFGNTYGEFRARDHSTGNADEARMDIRDTSLTRRFAGRRTIYSGQGMWGWGKPTGDVTILATAASDATKATAFYYDKGGRLADGSVSPGFRAGLFMRTAEIQGQDFTYSSYAWDLFDAMFAKCIPLVDKRIQLLQ